MSQASLQSLVDKCDDDVSYEDEEYLKYEEEGEAEYRGEDFNGNRDYFDYDDVASAGAVSVEAV